MLLLHGFEVRNVCQHAHLKIDNLQPGLIGIFGPNGSGKTNLIQAIKASLTNDFGWASTNKANKVRRQRQLDDPAFVRTEWSIDRQPLQLTRSLVAAESSLVYADKQLQRDAEIRTLLAEVLGLSSHVLENYVFVDQGQTSAFLRAKPSERLNNFAHLCGVSHLEDLWQLLGEQVSKARAYAQHDAASEQVLANQVQELERLVESLTAEAATHQANRLTDKQLKRYTELQQRATERARLEKEWATRRASRRDILAQLKEAKKNLEAVEREAARLAARQAELKPQYETAKQVLLDNERRHAAAVQRAQLEKKLRGKVLPPAVEEPPPAEEVDRLKLEISRAEEALRHAREALQQFESGGGTACPLCGTTVASIAEKLDSYRADQKKLPARISKLREQLTVAVRKTTAFETWQRELQRVQSERNYLQGQLEAIPKEPVDEAAAKWAEQLVLDYEETCLPVIQQTDAAVRRLTPQVATLRGRLRSEKDLIEAIEARLKAEAVPAEQLQQQRQALELHQAATAQLIRIGAAIEANQQQLAAQRALQARMHQQREIATRASNWIDSLELYRQVVHRNNLPAKYMQHAMAELLVDVNRNLSDFGGKFRLSFDQNLAFVVTNRDGTVEPASAKSGGEAAGLAIAYRLAVSARFASQVGVMFLDEPTAGMDEYHLGCLAEILLRVNEVTQKRRQQLFMITHDKRMERVFDQIITLK